MSKTKAASRLLSSLLAILMVFCLFPKVEVQAEGESLPTEYYIRYTDVNNNNGANSFVDEMLQEQNPINIPTHVQQGETISIPAPANFDFTDNRPGLTQGVHVSLSTIEVYGIPDDGSVYDWPTFCYITADEYRDGFTTVTIPADFIGSVIFTYTWKIDGYLSDLPSESDVAVITNWIASLDRNVTQKGETLPVTSGSIDTYALQNESKDDVVLTYNASMTMENLGVNGDTAAGSWWDMLNTYRSWIGNETIVYLHFVFDDAFDLSRANFDSVTLTSDMFRLDHYDVVGQEVIFTCYWYGENANNIQGDLNPLIELKNVVVPIKNDWEGSTLTLSNYGYVDGMVYMYAFGNMNRQPEECVIDGGEEYDTFALTLPEPELPPEESSESSEDPDEPSTIIPDDGPTISIRKVWVEDTEEDRPDSILVEIYHDEELYDTVEVEEKYRWRTSYNIPERYENDDWWVQEADVPAGYEDYIDETRDNVFVITNTYVGVEEESSEESSEPSVTPSEPSVEPSEPSSEPSEPVSEPEEPAEPTLPQTGQVWWPIIILLAGGAVLVAFGAFRTMRGSRRHDR